MRARFLSLLLILSALPASAAITGTIMTTGGAAIGGAKVSIYPLERLDVRRARLLSKTPERQPLASMQTDSKGKFSLDSPKEPVVEVLVEAKGYAPILRRAESDDDLGAQPLSPAEMKRGTITANGKPVAGANVIWMASGAESMATTDAAGKYSVPDPEKWGARMMVVHPDFAVSEDSLFPGKRDLNRSLSAGTAITGKVVAEDGTTPVAKATVYVDGRPLATTADDGTFTVPHALKWETIEVRSGDLAGLRANTSAKTAIRLVRGASVSGSVRDVKTQTGLAGAEVRLVRGNRFEQNITSTAITDAKGNFSMSGMAPGSYSVTGFRPGYAILATTATLTAGQKASKTLPATPMGRVSGIVADEDRKGVAAALLEPHQVSRDPMAMMGRMVRGDLDTFAYSGPDGRFAARVEPDTDLQLDASKRGQPTAKSASFRLGPGERKSGVVITIPRGFALRGRVLDRNGKPVSGVGVVANETEGRGGNFAIVRRFIGVGGAAAAEPVRTGTDGTFAMQLKEGTYDVTFQREGFASKVVRAQQVTPSTPAVEVTLDPGVAIVGRVTRGGAGVEGVNIGALSALMSDRNASAITAPDGSFRIDDLTPGPVSLVIGKESSFIQQMRNVTAPAENLVIDLPLGGRIAGRVVDKSTHDPVTSFQAGISNSRGAGGMVMMMPPQLRSFTSDDGSFALENVPPGPVNLVVMAPGYTTGRAPNLTVEDGKDISGIEVQLDTGVRVTGRVTGPDGAPLSAASVRIDSAAGAMRGMRMPGAGDSPTFTDANGEYVMEAVEPGEKTLVFNHSGLLPDEKTVTLSGRDARVDAQLSAGRRVTGQVVTEGGVPVGEATVRAMSAASAAIMGKTTQSDGSGAFAFEGLTPGHYTFTASKSGYADGTLRDYDVSAGAPLTIVVKTGGTVFGHVSGLADNELQHTSVLVRGSNGSTSAPVDASGNYRVEGTPVGTVRVSAEMSQGIGQGRTSTMKAAQVDAGGSVQVDIEFKSATVVQGRVTRNGAPLVNATVLFSPRESTATTTARVSTDGGGNYSVSGLDDATYNVNVVDMQRMSPYSTTYIVKGSDTLNIDIKASAVRGRVIDATSGQPLENARVDLQRTDNDGGNSMFGTHSAPTDSQGGFVFDSIVPGNYHATASMAGYGNDSRNIVVAETPGQDLEFKIAVNPGITLRVVDKRDSTMLNAFVRGTDDAGAAIPQPSFKFGGVAEPVQISVGPGTYHLNVSAQGYATQNVTVVSPSDQRVELTPGGTLVVKSSGKVPERARLIDEAGRVYASSSSFFGRSDYFTLVPNPGETTVNNIAPGTYRVQVLDAQGHPVREAQVVVVEGGSVTVGV